MPKRTVNKNTPEYWINEYKKIRPIHDEFCNRLQILIEDLLSKEAIKFQVVEKRAKSVDSFTEKLNRYGKTYTNPLKEMADLSGVRIIVYYTGDVDKVCDILYREFKVDDSRSVNKRATLTADQFGYLSVHKVVSLSDTRSQLPEWSPFNYLIVEIQVRTVLQHAWAAISHALQYKKEAQIPKQLRRKLIRLSGLLELADEQFSDLRREHVTVEKEVVKLIEERELDIAIDALTISEFAIKSDVARAIVKAAGDAGLDVSWNMPPESPNLVSACELLEIETVSQLEEQLISLYPKANSFFKDFYTKHIKKSSSIRIGGDIDHWLAVAILGANSNKLTQEDAYKKLEWNQGYIDDLFAAGEIFRYS